MVYTACVLSFSSLARVGEVCSARRSGVGKSHFWYWGLKRNARWVTTLGPTRWFGPDGCADFDKAPTSCWVQRRSSKRARRDYTRAQTAKKCAGTLGGVQEHATCVPSACRGGSYVGGAGWIVLILPPLMPRRQTTGPRSLLRDSVGQQMPEYAGSPPISHCSGQNLSETFSKTHHRSQDRRWIPKEEQRTLAQRRLTRIPWETLRLRQDPDACGVNHSQGNSRRSQT